MATINLVQIKALLLKIHRGPYGAAAVINNYAETDSTVVGLYHLKDPRGGIGDGPGPRARGYTQDAWWLCSYDDAEAIYNI